MPLNKTGPVILDVLSFALNDEEKEVLCHPQVGGVILFGRNIDSAKQVADLTRHIRSTNPNLLLCVDQEGGRVQRLKNGFTRLPPMGHLGQLYSSEPALALDISEQLGWLMASEVLGVGIDLSFAPVLDVDSHFSQVIGDRAFSPVPMQVELLGGAFMAGMQRAGMANCGKHFPGHGSVKADSHLELPVDARPMQAIEEHDLRPFRALLPKLAALMPAHIIFPAVDPNPVGFSAAWLQGILRKQMGFNGVIISDDLSMAGAAFAGDYPARAQMALEAGCDGILVCNQPAKAHQVLEFLEGINRKTDGRLQTLQSQSALPLALLHAEAPWHQANELIAR
ncbi:MAG TPA: beta-N-acetylhexosaminidase, partial [Cellvibrionaceae bacterium]|nr:beta-N-acetylhexosaminidase [Cellvibrionaceae bacterium]